jgi:hypothetical protein
MQNLTHLKPAEDDVKIGRGPLESQAAGHLRRAAKPPEKEKQVADADTLICEMCGSRPDLAKGRLPAPRARTGFHPEVGIQVNAAGWTDSLVGERGDDPGKRLAAPRDVSEARKLARRYGQRAQ